ncbi:dolichol-phosphate mannosyltransferase [Blastococcus colisei]|uniref:Dolichol-phosphate mannosyltransferase n=1 Tax=Blastococcus colisei TaxID=1564162 RepID=A0A543PBP7_9ACTN|nr:glycosyltransferase family 2 protein [Blastococcus colisei]TQN41495.1 dolichol-phosphate mannosyltransferase [Blastococcus colisei]
MISHPTSPAPSPAAAATEGPLVSLVVPAFNEAENVAGLVELVRQIDANHPGHRFELVVVDDGSSDGTPDLLRAALDGGPVTARIVALSRNFGSHAAITAGFRAARGACAMTLSADLQEPMEVIGRFLAAWEAGNDVVWGVRSTRSVPTGLGNALSRAFSRWFHRWSTIPTYPAEGPSIVLVSRAILEVVNGMQESNRNIFGLVAWAGFNQTTVGFEQLPRPAGRSKWTNAKKIKLVVDSFVEFSQAPARVAGYLGAIICVLAVLAALVAVILAVATDGSAGYWFVTSAVLLTGGLNLGFLSVMGEYVWRAGDDARQRPIYVMRSVHDVVAHRPVAEHAHGSAAAPASPAAAVATAAPAATMPGAATAPIPAVAHARGSATASGA